MRPKKQKKGWKHDAGDAGFDVLFECPLRSPLKSTLSLA